tara:strand:- start:525 stop:848 length:324 start_codon:yes stop_codon:yes gene_type:complete
MEVTGMQIGFDALLSLISGIVGALTVWYTLKNKVEIQQLILNNLKGDIMELKMREKDSNTLLHKRIESLKTQVELNRQKSDATASELKSEMNAMELRIIQAIHDIKK